MTDSKKQTNEVANSESTDKRLVIDDQGIVIGNEKRVHLVIEGHIQPDDRTADNEWEELARFSMTRDRSISLMSALDSSFDIIKYFKDKDRASVQQDNIKYIIYALERAHNDLSTLANKLFEARDYSAEFPSEDANRIKEAMTIVEGYSDLVNAAQNAMRFIKQHHWIHPAPAKPQWNLEAAGMAYDQLKNAVENIQMDKKS